MQEEAERPNPLAAGLEEWEHPLGSGAEPAVGTRSAIPRRGQIRIAGATLPPTEPSSRASDDSFNKGLGAWEHPLGRRR